MMMEFLIIKKMYVLLCLLGFVSLGEPVTERRKRINTKTRKSTSKKSASKTEKKAKKVKPPKPIVYSQFELDLLNRYHICRDWPA